MQVTEPPFRALDEWDVYLDAVNRSDVYKEMIRVALEQVTNLFVIRLLFYRMFFPDFHLLSTGTYLVWHRIHNGFFQCCGSVTEQS
jgi:hypothetical protein